MKLRIFAASLFALSASACHGAGPYGFAVQYAPLEAESHATANAREYDPVMVQRDPEGWRKQPTTLFGVVTRRAPGPSGQAYLTISVRRLEPRNLCANANDEDSCRVSVSDRDFGVVHAIVALRHEDDVGETSLGIGSLVRIVGKLDESNDPADGAPVIRATYYRHWPRNFYVTRASAVNLRQ
jgi:hypothetical protein